MAIESKLNKKKNFNLLHKLLSKVTAPQVYTFLQRFTFVIEAIFLVNSARQIFETVVISNFNLIFSSL